MLCREFPTEKKKTCISLKAHKPVKDTLWARQLNVEARPREERPLPAALGRLKPKIAMELIKLLLLYVCCNSYV